MRKHKRHNSKKYNAATNKKRLNHIDYILETFEDYKPGHKDHCQSLELENDETYMNEVLSNFYAGNRTFSQSEELHYCWIKINYKLDRDRPLEVYAYTGKSGAIWGRLQTTTHGDIEVDRSEKILIHTTISSKQSHKDLKQADEFNEITNECATVPQVEQSNINAIRAVRTIKSLNRKDEDSNRIINPVLVEKLKRLERMVEQLNNHLIKLNNLWLNNELIEKIDKNQIKDAFLKCIMKEFGKMDSEKHHELFETGLTVDFPAMKQYIEPRPANLKSIEKAKNILKGIRGCEFFHNLDMGLVYCSKFLFSQAIEKEMKNHKAFFERLRQLEKEIVEEDEGKREKRSKLRKDKTYIDSQEKNYVNDYLDHRLVTKLAHSEKKLNEWLKGLKRRKLMAYRAVQKFNQMIDILIKEQRLDEIEMIVEKLDYWKNQIKKFNKMQKDCLYEIDTYTQYIKANKDRKGHEAGYLYRKHLDPYRF